MNDPQMSALMDQLRRTEGFRLPQDGFGTRAFESFTPAVDILQGGFPLLQRHIKIDGRDFFWLANNTNDYQNCDAQIWDVAGVASIWDCESGQIRPVEVQASEDRQLTAKDPKTMQVIHQTRRKTHVRLSFKPYEAYWLVVDPQAQLTAEQIEKAKQFVETGVLQVAKEDKESTAAVEVAGPWHISVDAAGQPSLPNPGVLPGELSAGVDRPLEDWNAWGLPAFSGFVDYAATFEFNGNTAGARLDLGNVMHMAEVWLNGRPLGAKLWPQYVWDVSEIIKAGPNSIKVKVGNLIDKNFGGKSESGLFGPVRITYPKPPEVESAETPASVEETLKAWRGRVKKPEDVFRRRLAPRRP